jgi:uncharacterized protein YggE
MKSLIVCALLLLCPLSASADELANIQVSGTGSVQALPDFINIDISIEKTNKDRAVAKNEADVITQQVLDALTSLSIEDKHVQASQLFISPQYQWNEQTRVLVGERAVRTVQIKLYDLDRYSALADKLVNIDITRFQQRGFGFEHIETHQNEALVEALKNARVKAEVIAKQIGREIGETFQVHESSAQPAPTMRLASAPMMADSAMESSPAPLEIKKQTINSSINVIYLLK